MSFRVAECHLVCIVLAPGAQDDMCRVARTQVSNDLPGADRRDGDRGLVGLTWWQDACEYAVCGNNADHQGPGQSFAVSEGGAGEV